MSLRKMIGRGLVCLAQKVGNAAGTAIEKLGNAVHSQKIQDAGVKLQASCNFGQSSWGKNSSVARTVDVHKELHNVIESVEQQAKTIENQIISICISEVGVILEQLSALLPACGLLQLKENYPSRIRKKLSGNIMKFVQPKLSLDNPECREILEISDDRERMEKAAAFKESVLHSAGLHFKKLCAAEKKKYCKEMLDLSEHELQAAQREFETQKNLCRQMLQGTKDTDTIDLEREQALISIERLKLLSAVAFAQRPESKVI